MLTDAQTERHLAQTGWQVIAGDKQGRTWRNPDSGQTVIVPLNPSHPAYESTLQRLHADLATSCRANRESAKFVLTRG